MLLTMNINITIQYDADFEAGSPDPISFAAIKRLRETVNAPAYATLQMIPEAYGWEIRIHWNTEVGVR